MAKINIYGTLFAATADGIIAEASQIKDVALNKMQDEINAMVVGDGSGEGSLPQQIADVLRQLNEFKATKGQPDGLASLNENGKIDPSQLDGTLGRVQGLQKFLENQAALATDPDATSAVEGQQFFCKAEKLIFTKTIDGWDEGRAPQGDTIYNHRLADEQGRTNVLYRWDGENMTEISASLTIGTVTGTAFDGGKGKALEDLVASMGAKIITSVDAATADADKVTFNYKAISKGAANFDPEAAATVEIPAATESAAGVMKASDKKNLDTLITIMGGDPEDPEKPIDPEAADYLKKSDAGVGIVKDYTKGIAKEAIAAGDTIAVALGKLEYSIDNIFGGEGSTGGDITIPEIPEPDGTDVPVIDEPTNDTIGSEITPDQLPENGDDLKTIIAKQNQLIEVLNKKIQLLNALVQPEGYQLVYVEAEPQP